MGSLVGPFVGGLDGEVDGSSVVGNKVGLDEGSVVGLKVGWLVGPFVGGLDGEVDGCFEGG